MTLTNPARFFDTVRGPKSAPGVLGPVLDQGEVEGCNDILAAFAGCPTSWVAYALATACHETAGTMRPIREIGSTSYLTRMYDITGKNPDRARAYGNTRPGDGPRYCGRGFVQLTWKTNYAKASTVTGVDLVANPDRAMERPIAAQIMRHGMEQGWFTGGKLSKYLPHGQAQFAQFVAARRIINGIDKSQHIARLAGQFQHALNNGGYVA